KQCRIRLGHAGVADALRRLHHASALRQIKGEPAGGAVIRREHASRAFARANRFDPGSKLAPADTDATHGGVAAIAREHAGIGLHDQQRKHQDACWRSPAPTKIDDPLPARRTLCENSEYASTEPERPIRRAKPI